MQQKINDKGFTLVELAIVMIIIGLLIGGVLKGQQLIENAKTTAVIAQVKGFQAALNSFRDAYGGTPGDMSNADRRLSGCDTGNTNNCISGSGNGLVDDGNAGGLNWRTSVVSWAVNGAINEPVLFWKHLALADLITGVDPTASTAIADLAWGESHPSSSLRGGYELYYDGATTAGESGHWLRMSNQGLESSNNSVGVTGESSATALQAANIDRKLDDGRPISGTVIVNYGGAAWTDCRTGDEYEEQAESKSCVMFFLIDG